MTRDAAEVAQASADAMWAEDKASRAMGMKVEKVGPGLAVLSMSVGANMVNGHGLCHGGYIFSLADSAFAFACNSHNQRHVAQHCQISYLAPGRLGMRLTSFFAQQAAQVHPCCSNGRLTFREPANQSDL